MAGPRIEVEISADVKDLQKGVKQAGAALSGFDKTAGATASASNSLSKSMAVTGRSMNQGAAAAISFNRVIQDAPYGIMGVSNNITQLAEQFTYLRKETGSGSKALKIAFSSLISPMNLAVLGISLATTALTYFSMRSREAKEETKDFVDTLGALDAARLKGDQKAQKELSTLEILYARTQDVTLSIDNRRKAVDQLQKGFPDYFKNIKDEAILNGAAKTSYDELRVSIIATAQALAAQNKINDIASKTLENNLKINKLAVDASKQAKEAAEAALGANVASTSQFGTTNLISLQKSVQEANRLTDIQAEITAINKENVDLYKVMDSLTDDINANLDKGGSLTGNIKDEVDKANDSFDRMSLKLAYLSAKFGSIRIAQPDVGELDRGITIAPGSVNIEGIIPQVQAAAEDLADAFNETASRSLNQGLVDVFSGLGKAVGEAISSGGNALQAAGASLLAGLGNILVDLGKMAIKVGVGIEAIKVSLKTLNPFVAIAAGVALVALGSAFAAGASRLSDSMGGGIAGQGSGSNQGTFTTGEVIRSRDIRGDEAQLFLRGSDIYIAGNRYQAQIGRA